MFHSTLLKTTADQLIPTTRTNLNRLIKFTYCSSSTENNQFQKDDEFIFEAPEIFKPKQGYQDQDIVKARKHQFYDDKLETDTISRIPTNVDWTSIWSTAQTFDPNRVPLPVYQGAPHTSGYKTRMNRWQNSELIKIPNFLHLTPKAIKQQTDAIKKFCTKWPKQLNEKKLEELYPVTIYSQDRVHASPTIRDPLARVICLEININQLKLDDHARDKLIKLLDHRYDPRTGMIKIEASDCPMKEQNLELAIYRLTACYFESWKTEDWELNENKKQ